MKTKFSRKQIIKHIDQRMHEHRAQWDDMSSIGEHVYKELKKVRDMLNGTYNIYEVWMTQGQGGFPIKEFNTLDAALIFARKGIANKEGSFSIKYPTGEWHRWNS